MRNVPLSQPVETPVASAAEASANIASEIVQARSWGRWSRVYRTRVACAKRVATAVATNASPITIRLPERRQRRSVEPVIASGAQPRCDVDDRGTPAAGETGPRRQTSPTCRRSRGESATATAPAARAASASGAGRMLAPAPARTRATIASRCSVSTASVAAAPASANAPSMSRRIGVPGGVITSGTAARSRTVSRRRAGEG